MINPLYEKRIDKTWSEWQKFKYKQENDIQKANNDEVKVVEI